MRRDTGGHTDRNAFRSIDQDVRNTDRKHFRFFFGLVKVRDKVHDILIQICQVDVLRKLLQAGFGITHSCCAITFDGTEVSMAIYQGHAFFEFLLHDDQRLINGRVTMWMIFTHGITHDPCGFPVRPVRTKPQLGHRV